jgi:Leucine-rich repeat (LRR) protein
MGQITELFELSIVNSDLSAGPVPESIGLCAKLKVMHLYRCNLQGEFPAGVRSLKSIGISTGMANDIESLSFGNNKFSSNLPEWICELVMLENLDLSYNRFEDHIPECIGSLLQLRHLDLSRNAYLAGHFPVGICKLLNLESFSIYETSVEGDIPECIEALSKLSYFDVSDTNMGGLVPDSIGKLILLEDLYLGYETISNMFVGPLPSTMSKLVLLKTLYLKVPTLTGPLPDFGQLTRLEDCAFTPSQLCRVEEFVPANSRCDFTVLPECEGPELPDCIIFMWSRERMKNDHYEKML